MGWNSWNAFGTKLDEQTLLEVADVMVDRGLLTAGYDYFVIDDGWQHATRVGGRLVPDPDRFPSGMDWLGDQIRQHEITRSRTSFLYTMRPARR